MTRADKRDRNEILWRAAEMGDTCLAAEVLRDGVDIDLPNKHGVTSLMKAVAAGNIQMATFLLENGADPNRSRNDGFTPLLLAAFFGHTAIVRILIQHGADTRIATRSGTSAQMWATARTFKEVADYLQKQDKSLHSSKSNRPRKRQDVKASDDRHALLKEVVQSGTEGNSKVVSEVVDQKIAIVASPSKGLLDSVQKLKFSRRTALTCALVFLFMVGVTSARLVLRDKQTAAANTTHHATTEETKSAVNPSSARENISAPSGQREPEREVSNHSRDQSQIKLTSRISSQPRVSAAKPEQLQPAEVPIVSTETKDQPMPAVVTPEVAPPSTSAVAKKPTVNRSNTPAPLSNQLISPSKSSTKSGKVIAWP